ncbi:hypothetical protein LTR53_016317 [Teratosphaeriaceae sp. CCFEE 6253]|nr:hypothetical protein LTR53_016317 [Teratosphaeriaceae sp. CCFEE 6253]
MAETNGGGRDASTAERRSSFRRTMREHAGLLPPEYLEALEQKRKQLDESIHKYIAAKEREFKQYEKELKQQTKQSASASAAAAAVPLQSNGSAGGNGSSTTQKRRTSSESTQGSAASPFLAPQQQHNTVHALLSSNLRRDRAGHATIEEEEEVIERPGTANLSDRRASAEREKDFVGLFTPPYLPLIDHQDARTVPARPIERTASAPPDVEPSRRDTASEGGLEALPKADSESAMYAKYKRPVHLQLAKRTSSSGSSADGKLASAMKSPTQSLQRPKRKRVSLAVGDSIVAPSDNVPSALNNSSAPSHSRVRSPESEREDAGATASLDFARQPVALSQQHANSVGATSLTAAMQGSSHPDPAPAAAASSTPTRTSIDPDGDLFDLADELDEHAQLPDDSESAIESEEDVSSELAGRIPGLQAREGSHIPATSHRPRDDENATTDAPVDPLPDATPSTPAQSTQRAQAAATASFGPATSSYSSNSSQHPASPGFRRPTVAADPVFCGADYFHEEARAADEEIYGSRPEAKGSSFTAGSLGQSYMQRHAEEMMERRRVGAREQSVR